MRAPGEAAGIYALEAAVDDLADQLKLDPLELRRQNYAAADEFNQKPWSSKRLRECYDLGAELIGWRNRNPNPGGQRDTDGQLIGYGMATAIYPAAHQPSSARVILSRDGSVRVSIEFARGRRLGRASY
jgi:xanthine dehydrogenase YagR molybdenum-binding subunit